MHGLLLLLLILLGVIGFQKGSITRAQVGLLVALVLVIAIGRGS